MRYRRRSSMRSCYSSWLLLVYVFIETHFDDLLNPCWFSIINFCALDMLGNKYGELSIDYQLTNNLSHI